MSSHDFEVGPGCITLLGTIEDFGQVLNAVYTEVYVPSWIKYKGTNFRPGLTLLLSHSADGDSQFSTIQSIVVINSKVKIIVKNWETTGFKRHFFTFTVSPTSAIEVVDIDSIVDYRQCCEVPKRE